MSFYSLQIGRTYWLSMIFSGMSNPTGEEETMMDVEYTNSTGVPVDGMAPASALVLTAMGFIGLCSNMIALLVFFRRRCNRQTPIFPIATLAANDFIFSLFLFLLTVLKLVKKHLLLSASNDFCSSVYFLSCWYLATSPWLTCLLTVDRFNAIRSIFQFNQRKNKGPVPLLFLSVWFFGAATSGIQFMTSDDSPYTVILCRGKLRMPLWFICLITTTNMLPTLLVFSLHFRIRSIARTHQRCHLAKSILIALDQGFGQKARSMAVHGARVKRGKVALHASHSLQHCLDVRRTSCMLMAIAACCMACWLPSLGFWVLRYLYPAWAGLPDAWFICAAVYSSIPTINPLIYIARFRICQNCLRIP